MTTKELKKRILEAEDLEWFKSKTEIFNFPDINFSVEIKGVSAIYEFVDKQLNGWTKISDELPTGLQQSHNYFYNLKNKITEFVNISFKETDSRLNVRWDNIKSYIINNQQNIFTYNAPETQFLFNIYKQHRQFYQGAYDFITGEQLPDIAYNEYFTGILLAYEFSFKDTSDIVKRGKTEKASLNKLRDDFQKHLNESESQLIEHLTNATKKYNDYAKAIDKFKDEKAKKFAEWFNQSKMDFGKFDEQSKTKIKELEKTYQENLKLKEPAKYWNDRAKKLRNQGLWLLAIALILFIGTCIFLGKILWNTPEQIFSSWFGEDYGKAIRWSIIYVTLISFIAFCLRAILKVMFSSFHLARDCEERHTLTYFYLSLLKDSNVDEKDRQLIMQSLFSRAETGLLKDDSSPSMPNDIVGKIFGQ